MWTSEEEEGREEGEEFDLCPSNGDVSVQSALSASQLSSVSPMDLPFILSLDFEPDTTCWPPRYPTL